MYLYCFGFCGGSGGLVRVESRKEQKEGVNFRSLI